MRLSETDELSNIFIKKINLDHKIKNYLMSLGLENGTNIKVIKKPMFNGPMIIFVKNYHLCISHNICKNIEVDYN